MSNILNGAGPVDLQPLPASRGRRAGHSAAPQSCAPGPAPGQVRNNDVMFAIRRLASADLPAVTAIVRGLPRHFTSDVPLGAEQPRSHLRYGPSADTMTSAG
jgi:hypothetical protein